MCCCCSNLTRELLDYLAVCDSEFKPDLTAKIAALITRFAPDRRWHYDNLLCVLVQVRRGTRGRAEAGKGVLASMHSEHVSNDPIDPIKARRGGLKAPTLDDRRV